MAAGGAGCTVVPLCRSPTAGASRCWGSVLPIKVAIPMMLWSMHYKNVAFVILTQQKGLCSSIGVSNFLISHLEQLKEDSVITPHVNRVEYHPFQRPQELVGYCRSRDIVFEGYCPLAKGEVLTHPSIIQLAKKYGRTPAQICIHWNTQNGIVTIPKSTEAERIEENCKVFDFTIAEDDVEILNGMHDGRHVSWDPSLIMQMKEMIILLLPTFPMLLVFDFNLREEDMKFLNTMNINRKLIHLLSTVERVT
ncbi:LOW QUALITY PROTEIN: putative oxidoreductase YtbE [Buteo buteo]|uniref:LOW QUALITY PROTEIN: putative oxidoreductase YtbE n=1 Tax=Buteo buteo TaxID=30397 RepID=UPI003EB93177